MFQEAFSACRASHMKCSSLLPLRRHDGTVSVQVLIQMFNSYFGMIRGTGSTWFVRSEKIRHISSMGKATVTASNDFISFKTGCPREVLLRPCPSPSKILRP